MNFFGLINYQNKNIFQKMFVIKKTFCIFAYTY